MTTTFAAAELELSVAHVTHDFTNQWEGTWPMTRPYSDLPGFQSLYLEDSFILDVLARPGSVVFEVELVLTGDHPDYRPPPPNEQHCYRRGRITFEGVTRLTWLSKNISPARGATGEIDYGGFDTFRVNGSTFVVAGEFGELNLEASGCTVSMVEGWPVRE